MSILRRPLDATGRTIRTVTRRLGRRGAALGWFATLDVVFALSLADPTQQAQVRAAPSYRIIAYLDLRIWATVWLAVGMLCLIQAWMKDDRWAFSAQMTLLWVWAAFTIAAVGPQAPRAVVGGVVWATFGGFVLILSGWPESPRPPETPRPKEE